MGFIFRVAQNYNKDDVFLNSSIDHPDFNHKMRVLWENKLWAAFVYAIQTVAICKRTVLKRPYNSTSNSKTEKSLSVTSESNSMSVFDISID